MDKRIVLPIVLYCAAVLFVFAEGADASYPTIKDVLSRMEIPERQLYTVSEQDITLILDKAVDLDINLLELFDCMYRYLGSNNKRIELSGLVLRNAQAVFSYGDPLEFLLPIERLEKMQIGACFTQGQKPLDMYLTAPYSVYFKSITAAYEVRCGFGKVTPRTFLEPYGMFAKKWGMVKALRKFDLFAPGRCAIYVKGFLWAKKPYIDSVTRINGAS